ncbi:retrovirus-related pol polyprotein from transposon TNT 1-94 [Tanacetum coccineum]
MKLQTDSLQQKLNDQIYENNKFRAQLKGKFYESQMNDSGTSMNTKLSRPSTSGTKLYLVTPLPKSKVIPKVVEKNDFSKSVNAHLTTNKLIEKRTKVLSPGYASKFATRIQELLVYVSALCPFTQSGNEKWVPATSHKRNNKPNVDASRIKQTIKTITKEHAVKQNTCKTDNTMFPSTGRVISTNASGSKPRSNTKNDRIPQPSSRSMKNKVEAHHRKFKSSDNKNNHVSDCNANVRNVALLKNSDSIFLSCNECLFSTNHDTCVVQYLKKMQKRKLAKSAKQKVKSEWKPTVEVLGHNLFFVGQFCDSDLDVAFMKHTCFVRNLEGIDLLSGSRGSNLYTISMADMMKSSPICLLSKASKTKSWLWHRRLSHLKFGAINKLAKQGLIKGLPKLKYTKDHLCSACQMGKSKKESHPHKLEPSTNEKLQMLHMDMCGPMQVESINKKRYILVIIDDYSCFTWVTFLRTKDEALEIIIKFLKQAHVSENARIRYLHTNNGTEFLNQTLRNYTEDVGITYTTSTARTPQQNGVVERRNRTLQTRTQVSSRFGALCYPTNDFEDLMKLQLKANIRIFIGYSPSKKAY